MVGSSIAATISGRCCQTIFSDTSIASCFAPTARATGGCLFTFVGGAGRVETGGKGQHRLVVQPSHQGDQGRTIDAAGQEHPIWHVAALMQIDTFHQRLIQPPHRGVFIDVLGRRHRDRVDLPPLQDMAVGAGDGLTRQHPLDAFKDGVGAGGELELQQFLDRRRPYRALHQAGFQQRLRFRGERQPAIDSWRYTAA